MNLDYIHKHFKVFLPNYIISGFDTYIDQNLKEHMMKKLAISEYFNINYVIFLMRCIIFQTYVKNIYNTWIIQKLQKKYIKHEEYAHLHSTIDVKMRVYHIFAKCTENARYVLKIHTYIYNTCTIRKYTN